MQLMVLTLGGTIASTGEHGRAASPRLSAEDIVRAVPALSELGDVHARTVVTKASGDLGFTDLLEVAQTIKDAHASGLADAFVVTQGTDTLEESSFALALLLGSEIPVAMTGAMRNASLPGADGPANLLAAARVASSSSFRGCGLAVVVNDEVHAPAFVSKRHTSSPSTFSSAPFGAYGAVTERQVDFFAHPAPLPKLEITDAPSFPEVQIVSMALGDPGRILDLIDEDPPNGVVLAGFGGGHVPSWLAERLSSLAKQVPTVLSSRTGGGRVLRETYSFAGSEQDLLGRGLIFGGWLGPLKARVLLTLALAAGLTREDIASLFADTGVSRGSGDGIDGGGGS